MDITTTTVNSAQLLHCTGPAQQRLHADAGSLRERHFGRNVFVRGVVEVSNFCRENCAYCGMRRDNRDLHRYRLSAGLLLEGLLHHRPESITDINIQAGEDPVAVREIVLPLLRELRRNTTLGLSVCVGTLSPREYAALHEAGADYYVIKLETGDADHYRSLQSPGNLDERLAAIRHLAATGWNVSSGFIAGLPGQTDDMILRSLALLDHLPLAGCSVSPFIPGADTPLAAQPAANLDLTLNCLAMMRLNNPDRIIPAVSAMTLLDNGRGYVRALEAGANLVTINLTPPKERADYLLYTRNRSIMTEERILAAMTDAGCAPSRIGISEHLRTRTKSAAA